MTDDAPLGLRDLHLELGYDSADSALTQFYVPALARSIRYDRSVGYFRASALSAAAKGVSRFIAGGGTMRLLAGAEIGEDDRDALTDALDIPPSFAAKLTAALATDDDVQRRRLEVLAWLVRMGRLEVRVVVPVDREGRAVPPAEAVPYFHEKIGLLRDAAWDGVAFQGSVNESQTAWSTNFESFSVYKSWDAGAGYFDKWAAKFEARWAGDVAGFRVYPLPEAVREELVRLAPAEPPPARDVEEPEQGADVATLARFLQLAPRLANAAPLAEATTGVVPFPHQTRVVERLAGTYPRSWLVADEVGLGKTISAGLALRRLMLCGEVERVLIMAPANVARQWQDELFEKFGLWLPRIDGGKRHGAHPDDVRDLPPNPYADDDALIVSSHLARRARHQELILGAPAYDVIIVDEAHHARRRGADLDEYRPSRLLQLLDRIRDAGHTKALWLLTATPLQVHAVELVDLLRHVGLDGTLAEPPAFLRFHAELAKTDDAVTDWRYLASSLQTTPSLGLDLIDRGLLDRIGGKLGPVQRQRIESFGTAGADIDELVRSLGGDGRRELRAWVRQRGPIGRLVTRHTRYTLRRYRAAGLLREPIAERDVKAVTVRFTPEEQELYADLDDLLGRLNDAHGTRRGAGFVLTVYRRRLTSSWSAIERTLTNRIMRERQHLPIRTSLLDEDDLVDDFAEDLTELGEGVPVDDAQAVPLTAADLAEIDDYIERIHLVADSKFDQLTRDINLARSSGRPIIVFTQFTDTLDALRDRLHGAYRGHLATYTGRGGRQWLEDEGWVPVTKADLVAALHSGRVSVILATDAASEGLNLQAASYLVNYDLPWNPMRVEQRIGRIDRIGQAISPIFVRNYVIPGTVEEDVYSALSGRIDTFADLLGKLQPILGATEDAFRSIFRAPRSERALAKKREIDGLLARMNDLEASGIDLGDEDPMPEPDHAPPPLTLDDLRHVLADEMDMSLDAASAPATFDPTRVSRDAASWCALGSYGHPGLARILEAAEHRGDPSSSLVVRQLGRRAAIFRADRTPPQPVRSLRDLNDLGDPVTAGEADQRARDEVSGAVAADDGRYRAVLASQTSQWRRRKQQEFLALVHSVVNAESALNTRTGDGAVEPRLIWHELKKDEMHGWVNAQFFVGPSFLHLELAAVLPSRPAGPDPRSDDELRRERATTGQALVKLITEWQAVAK